jgi:hypothetical protein
MRMEPEVRRYIQREGGVRETVGDVMENEAPRETAGLRQDDGQILTR